MDVKANSRHYDRRRHARVVKDIFAVYATEEPFLEGLLTTENVSGSGILFRSQEALPVGSLMNLNIHLPDQMNPIPCEGRVVRAETVKNDPSSFNIGVSFTRIADADKKQLLRNLLTQDDLYLFI